MAGDDFLYADDGATTFYYAAYIALYLWLQFVLFILQYFLL